MNIFRRPDYQSDTTQFINQLKTSRPELAKEQREGRALSNFASTLPAPQSDLAAQTLKDPYIFDFLSLTKAHTERELELGLIQHISQFLLELMAERNQQLMRLISAQQCSHITSRVAQCLGALITPLNFPFPDAGQLNITQSELADFCRVSRSRFNEALLELERQDLLTVGYRSVQLKDVEGLRRYAT